MPAEIRGIVLFVAAVVMAAVLVAPMARQYVHEFRRGPRVMAVEFDGTWAGAVLEGNEIVPRLVRINPRDPPDPSKFTIGGGRIGGRVYTGVPAAIPEHWLGCWGMLNTSEAPPEWRERLSPQQAKEFEDLYCKAVEFYDRADVIDCALMRDGDLVCD